MEGLEFEVIQGMKNILQKYYPIIFCEIFKGSNSNLCPERTIEYIIDLGYNAFIFVNDSKSFTTLERYKKHNDESYNYLFIPKQSSISI